MQSNLLSKREIETMLYHVDNGVSHTENKLLAMCVCVCVCLHNLIFAIPLVVVQDVTVAAVISYRFRLDLRSSYVVPWLSNQGQTNRRTLCKLCYKDYI